MTSLRLAATLCAAALALAAPPAAAAPVPLAAFEDAAGDAPAALDLRRLAVLADGDDLLLVVTLGDAVPAAGPDGAVEIYVSAAPAVPGQPGPGRDTALPGRRVAFAGGRGWTAAVVLTGAPEAARAEAQQALGADAGRVLVPAPLTVRGRTVTARLPAAALGGRPGPATGFAALVVERGAAGARVRDALLPAGADQAAVLAPLATPEGVATVPFLTGPELMLPAAEAGAPPLPGPLPQAAPGGEGDRLAAPVPNAGPAAPPAISTGRSPSPSPAAAPAAAPAPAVSLAPNLMPRLAASPPPARSAPAGAPVVLTVSDLTGELLTAKGSVAGLQPMQFGRIVDGQGITVARVMVLRVLEDAILATVIAGKERVKPGQALLFDPAAPGEPR